MQPPTFFCQSHESDWMWKYRLVFLLPCFRDEWISSFQDSFSSLSSYLFLVFRSPQNGGGLRKTFFETQWRVKLNRHHAHSQTHRKDFTNSKVSVLNFFNEVKICFALVVFFPTLVGGRARSTNFHGSHYLAEKNRSEKSLESETRSRVVILYSAMRRFFHGFWKNNTRCHSTKVTCTLEVIRPHVLCVFFYAMDIRFFLF